MRNTGWICTEIWEWSHCWRGCSWMTLLCTGWRSRLDSWLRICCKLPHLNNSREDNWWLRLMKYRKARFRLEKSRRNSWWCRFKSSWADTKSHVLGCHRTARCSQDIGCTNSLAGNSQTSRRCTNWFRSRKTNSFCRCIGSCTSSLIGNSLNCTQCTRLLTCRMSNKACKVHISLESWGRSPWFCLGRCLRCIMNT